MADTKKKAKKGFSRLDFGDLAYDRPHKPASAKEAAARKEAIGVTAKGAPVKLGREGVVGKVLNRLSFLGPTADLGGDLGALATSPASMGARAFGQSASGTPQMYGDAAAAAPTPAPVPAPIPTGGETTVPMNVPPTNPAPFVGAAGEDRQALRGLLRGDQVAAINANHGVDDSESALEGFANSSVGRQISASLRGGVITPDLQQRALQSYEAFLGGVPGPGKTVQTKEPVEIDASTIKTKEGLRKVVEQAGQGPVVLKNAHDIGFSSDTAVIGKGFHTVVNPEHVVDAHEPPFMTQKGFLDVMKYLKG